MKIKNFDIEAAIFDLDGTLIDSTYIWAEIDKEFFHKRNMEIPNGYADSIAHLGLIEAANYTKAKYNIKESIPEIIKEWQDGCRFMYENTIQLKPYIFELLELLKSNGVKMAIATANSKDLYVPCLKRLGIYDFFDFILDVDGSKTGKNEVKLYRMISEKLCVSPNKTVVFEDIVTGLKTAFNGGYITIGVDDIHTKDSTEEKKKYSNLFIETFKELL